LETEAPFDCPMCGQGIVHLSTGPYLVFIRDRSYMLSGVDALRCDECGEVFVTPEEAEALNRQACDTIRQQKHLLSPEAIRTFREEHRLSQADLEAILHVAPKSVVRWERGTVFQSPSTDAFIRHLMAHPGEIIRGSAAVCLSVKTKRPRRGRPSPADYAPVETSASSNDMLVTDGLPAAA
jgi:HTH-type transcriptional regulator/antitoxin MqsA